MKRHFAKSLLPLTAVVVLAAPAAALARHGSDDPANHVRREHHRLQHHARGNDDGVNHARHGLDDNAGHR
jgi:hypothetical protein